MAEKEKTPDEKGNKTDEQPDQSTKDEEIESKPSTSESAEKPQGQKKQISGKPDQQPKKKEKKGKQGASESEAVSKKKEHGENFNYIVRIANTDINGESSIVQGLTQIRGIGRHMAVFIVDTAGVDRKIKFGNLPEPDIEKLKEILENLDEYAPVWMLNLRKDLYTGEDMHLISTDIATRLRDDVNLMKMIRSYKGVRHELGLKVRGQRTSSNGRKGLALGVSKRREAQASAGKKEEKKE